MVNWLDILAAECEKSNKAEVGRQIGYSRTAISLALSGKYVGSTEKLAQAVISTFSDNLHCPHLQATINPDECVDFQSRPIPQSNATALRHWRACQSCPAAVGKGDNHEVA